MAEGAGKVGAAGTTEARPAHMVQKFTPLPTSIWLGGRGIQSVPGVAMFGTAYIAEHAASSCRGVLRENLPDALALLDGPNIRMGFGSFNDHG
jgi:hypothetical protein